MPKSFDAVLTINADGRMMRSSPSRSPLLHAKVEKLDAGVFQLNADGSGAACVAAQGRVDRFDGRRVDGEGRRNPRRTLPSGRGGRDGSDGFERLGERKDEGVLVEREYLA